MPSVVCLPPKTVRRCLEDHLGYRLIEKDEYNWAFAKSADDVPLLIPHSVPFIPMAMMSLPVLREIALTYRPTDQEWADAQAADTDD